MNRKSLSQLFKVLAGVLAGLLLLLAAARPVWAEGWRSLAAGGGHTVAVRSDGTLWAWGFNFIGAVILQLFEPKPEWLASQALEISLKIRELLSIPLLF